MAKRTRKNRKTKKRKTKARRAARRAIRRSRPAARRPARRTRAGLKPAGGLAPGMQPINAYLAVRDVAQALAFYERAFGLKRRVAMPGPDGKLMHAELTHRESVIMLGPESTRSQAPGHSSRSPVTLYIYVDDVDRVTAQAKEAGGTVEEEPKDQFWGDRTSLVLDPDGHRWMLATFKKLVAPEDMKPPAA